MIYTTMALILFTFEFFKIWVYNNVSEAYHLASKEVKSLYEVLNDWYESSKAK